MFHSNKPRAEYGFSLGQLAANFMLIICIHRPIFHPVGSSITQLSIRHRGKEERRGENTGVSLAFSHNSIRAAMYVLYYAVIALYYQQPKVLLCRVPNPVLAHLAYGSHGYLRSKEACGEISLGESSIRCRLGKATFWP